MRKKEWLKQKSQDSGQATFKCKRWERNVQTERMGFTHPGKRWTADMSRAGKHSPFRKNTVGQSEKNPRLQNTQFSERLWLCTALGRLTLGMNMSSPSGTCKGNSSPKLIHDAGSHFFPSSIVEVSLIQPPCTALPKCSCWTCLGKKHNEAYA